MTEYSVVLEHDADNITLLCGYHHDMKTRGQISKSAIQSYNANPKNMGRGRTSPHSLLDFGDKAEIIVGGNQIFSNGHAVSVLKIDGHSLLDVELLDEMVVFNLDFRDQDGQPVLTISQSELVHSTHLWDYSFSGTTLTIREGQGRIYLAIKFLPENHQVIINNGLVSHNGVDLLFDHRGFAILNNRMFFSGNTMQGLDAAISVGGDPERTGVTFLRAEIYRGPYDREAAIAWARKQMKDAENRRADRTRRPAFSNSPQANAAQAALSACPYPWERTTCGVPLFWP